FRHSCEVSNGIAKGARATRALDHAADEFGRKGVPLSEPVTHEGFQRGRCTSPIRTGTTWNCARPFRHTRLEVILFLDTPAAGTIAVVGLAPMKLAWLSLAVVLTRASVSFALAPLSE